ncbi:MAG: cyclase family protein [Flavobacteriales bacterium]
MKVELTIANTAYKADLTAPIDISIPLSPEGPRAWYVDRMIIRPVQGEGFIGDVSQGGSVNFRDIHFNPHGHGTHTESYEHVAAVSRPVGTLLSKYFFTSQVVTITPISSDGDHVITAQQLKSLTIDTVEALVVRTQPNFLEKKSKNYSDSNFPYFEADALEYLAEKNIQHLLVDLPSVDREHDEGKLAAHKAFWKNGDLSREQCTITEFIFVPDEIKDGMYLLELQFPAFVNDASPSRPVLYQLFESR